MPRFLRNLVKSLVAFWSVLFLAGAIGCASNDDSVMITLDSVAPIINSISVSPAITSVTITWNTDELTVGQVDLGTSQNYGSSETDAILGSSHTVQFGGLSGNTEYHYRITAIDSAGNATITPDQTFVTLEGITKISAGGAHSCAITASGGVKCWGKNIYGQLGDGRESIEYDDIPDDVLDLNSGIVDITAGESHTCALTASGAVKCWGLNDAGQLGDGTSANYRSVPVDVMGLSSGVAAIAAEGSHTCALTTSGGVKCWGRNIYGQIGDGTTTNRFVPVDVSGLSAGVSAITVGSYHACALTSSGDVKCWGYFADSFNSSVPVTVMASSGVTAIAAGAVYTCAINSSGGVICWGNNGSGRLGDGTTTSSSTPVNVVGLSNGVAGIAVGESHACALTFSGGVQCWGNNNNGQLGDGTTASFRASPVDVVGLPSGVTALASGTLHACARISSGGIRCWGNNGSGQLGKSTTSNYRTVSVDAIGLSSGVNAIGAGERHTCAVNSAGGVQCWGDNSYGELGDGTTNSHSIPRDVSDLTSGVVTIAAGGSHTCALTDSGGVKCWGYNQYGQLGDGTGTNRSTPVDVVRLASGVAAITAGRDHSCAITVSGGVQCWGDNPYGQLGDGTTTLRTTPVEVSGLSGGVVAITAGESHTCALTDSGGVKCWGYNQYGQLGDGTTTYHTIPVDVLGLTSGVIEITADGSHTCALTVSGGVKCWGYNNNGQLGDGTTTDRTSSVDVVGLSSGVIDITGGGAHTCALTASGGVKCWGDNDYGQLGDGSTSDRTTPVDTVEFANGVAAVSAGGSHTCVLTDSGGIKCWGNNIYSQLGDGTGFLGYPFDRYIPPVDVGGFY